MYKLFEKKLITLFKKLLNSRTDYCYEFGITKLIIRCETGTFQTSKANVDF